MFSIQIIFIVLIGQIEQIQMFSINRPKLCPTALWNNTGTPLAIGGAEIKNINAYMFIDEDDNIFYQNSSDRKIYMWYNGITQAEVVTLALSTRYGNPIFTKSRHVFIADNNRRRIERWSIDNKNWTSSIIINDQCWSLFVDINDKIYCVLWARHQVNVYASMNASVPMFTYGNGSRGSGPSMLNYPRGIYVTEKGDLYVADFDNNRIQLFRQGERNATTVANESSHPKLRRPSEILLDADGFLFILNYGSGSIIASSPFGFRCVVGCNDSKTLFDDLRDSWSFGFDRSGNLYVVSGASRHILKFALISNQCDQLNATETSLKLTLIPGRSNQSHPIRIRREEDFYVTSNVEIISNNSFHLKYQWTMKDCLTSINIQSDQANIANEYFLPARTLPLGLYRLELNVTTDRFPIIQTSEFIYILITPSGITANLVPLGTSMITSGEKKSLHFNPGKFSIDLDHDGEFNASDWDYDYYCRIYGMSSFPNSQGIYLTIDENQTDTKNPTCFGDYSSLFNFITPKLWNYHGNPKSIKSAITFSGNIFRSNQTYQWMVRMRNKRNGSLEATGYVLVRIEDTLPQLIIIGCVIPNQCIPNIQTQRVNPTTQVALLSSCYENCSQIEKISWNIYKGTMNKSSNVTNWILFDQMSTLENIWFFGRFTNHFTATSELFVFNRDIEFWRFEVVYKFISETSTSALNFQINQSPSNGSCSIRPDRGTTMTLFVVDCPGWIDDDDIKDYTVYIRSIEDEIVTFSTSSTFDFRLSSGEHQLIVSIRDKRDCVIEWNLTRISVQSDRTILDDLMKQFEISLNPSSNNVIDRLLSNGNQNIVTQMINSISKDLNENIAAESSMNQSLKIFDTQAKFRQYLMGFVDQLEIGHTSNILKTQSTTLALLTEETRTLTRKSLKLASRRCLNLGQILKKISNRIPFEDLQLTTRQLYRCATNLLNGVNGPLQETMDILPTDLLEFDEDQLEQNHFYQHKLSKEIQNEMENLISSLTFGLNLHLTLNQSFQMNISSLKMFFEKTPLDNYLNRTFANGLVHFPLNIDNKNQMKSIRFYMNNLSSYGSQDYSMNTNLSPSISLSLLNNNGDPISIQTKTKDPFVIFIPRHPSFVLPEMFIQNVTSSSSSSLTNQSFFKYHRVDLNPHLNQSIHFEFQSLNINLSYLFVYRFHHQPRLPRQIDGHRYFCASNLPNDKIFKFYLDNQQTFGYRSIIFGIREFNFTEVDLYCDKSVDQSIVPTFDQPVHFTSDYRLRLYQSACYYLDEKNQWKSDGLKVGPLTNHNQTQCLAEHLTIFTSTLTFLSEPFRLDDDDRSIVHRFTRHAENICLTDNDQLMRQICINQTNFENF